MFGFSYEAIREAQLYAYFISSVLLVLLFYFYIYHLYKNQKSGKKDYEKYSKLVLDDSLDSKLLEDRKDKEK
jgi:cytochrome c oxidase cbb3-type subunit 4